MTKEQIENLLNQVRNEYELAKKEELLEEILKLDPNNIEAHWKRAKIYKAYSSLEDDDNVRDVLLHKLEEEYQFLLANTEGHVREAYEHDRNSFHLQMGISK